MQSTLMGYTLKREIAITSTAMTGRRMKVVFGGDDAWTDGKIIHLPAVHDAQLYPVNEARVMRGYSNHEGAHNVYTPMDELQRLRSGTAGIDLSVEDNFKKLDRRTLIRVHSSFNNWNAAEDWRIERNTMRDWPGTRQNLDATRTHVVTRELKGFQAQPERLHDPFAAACAGLTWKNAVENQYSCAPKARLCLDLLKQENPFVFDLIEKAWPNIVAAGDLDDLAANRQIYRIGEEICDAIMAKYPPEEPQQKQKQQGGDGQGNGQGQGPDPSNCSGPGQGQGKGDDPSKDQDQDQGQGQTPGQDPGGDPTPDQDSSQGGGQGQDQKVDDQHPTSGSQSGNPPPSPGDDQGPNNSQGTGQNDDPAQPASQPSSPGQPNPTGSPQAGDPSQDDKIAQAARDHVPGDQKSLDISDIADKIAKITQALPGGGTAPSPTPLGAEVKVLPANREKTSLGLYNSRRAEISGVTSALAGSMRALVIAKDRRKFSFNRDDGDLDMANITSLALRTGDIYERQTISPANNTAITFLLDISISMRNGGKSNGGKRRIDLLFDTVVAMTEALGPARRVSTRYLAYTNTDDGIELHMVKDFLDNVVTAKHSVDRLMENLDRGLITMGATPTGEAMLEGWTAMRDRKENKKILMIITDGEPNDPKLAEQAGNSIAADFGHVIGIAVGSGKPQFPLKHWVTVPQIEELPRTILTALRPVL